MGKQKRGSSKRLPRFAVNVEKALRLAGEPQPQLYRPAAAIEDELVQALQRVYENIAGIQADGTRPPVKRSVVGRQTDAVVLVVEGIEGLDAALHRSSLGARHE